MPADPHRVVIVRRIVAVDGPARVNVILDVRAGFGRSPMTDLSRRAGAGPAAAGACGSAGRARPARGPATAGSPSP